MSFTREELLRQKALVQEQLAWIEDKLQALDSDAHAPPAAPPPAPPPAPAASPPPVPDPTAPSAPAKTDAKPPPPPEFLPREYLDGPTTSTRSMTFGCIVLVALAAAAVLFLLFGLPYLL